MHFSVRRPARRPATALTALLLAGSLALSACSGDAEPGEPEESPEAQRTADGFTLAGQWPLTGLPAEGDAPAYPPLVVKIDNTGSSNPQIGLGKADLVAEQLVEGGSTRLAVFYHSQLPKTVGPVRSMRASDLGIIEPADAVMVASGGAPQTVRRMSSAGVRTVTEGGTGYRRDSGRVSPYNLFMDLPQLAETLKRKQPTAPYFSWGSEGALPRGKKARSIAATFSAGQTTEWAFRKGSYVNTNSQAAAGDRFQPATVLALRVPIVDAGYKDPAGNPVPETKFTGSGEAMVFHGGRVVTATWSKKGLAASLRLKTKSGALSLPPGKVWVELVPRDGGDVRYSKK